MKYRLLIIFKVTSNTEIIIMYLGYVHLIFRCVIQNYQNLNYGLRIRVKSIKVKLCEANFGLAVYASYLHIKIYGFNNLLSNICKRCNKFTRETFDLEVNRRVIIGLIKACQNKHAIYKRI